MRGKRMLSILLILAMVLTMTAAPSLAQEQDAEAVFKDMPDNWATSALTRAVSNGLISGYETDEGLMIRPDGGLTRAEMAAVVNRAFGAQKAEPLSGVSDVAPGPGTPRTWLRRWAWGPLPRIPGCVLRTRSPARRP